MAAACLVPCGRSQEEWQLDCRITQVGPVESVESSVESVESSVESVESSVEFVELSKFAGATALSTPFGQTQRQTMF